MGSEPSGPAEYQKQELKSVHPWQQKSWVVWEKHKNYIQTPFPIDKKRYDEWRSNVAKVASSPMKEFLYISDEMGYVPY